MTARPLMRLSVLFLLAVIGRQSGLLADGPEDNRDDVVRTIPPPGEIEQTEVSRLLEQCTQVRSLWQSTREQLLAKTPDRMRAGILQRLEDLEPEVLVFPRAVELAVEFRQFYRDTDSQRADENLAIARRRIDLIKRGAEWEEVVGISDGSKQQLVVGGFRSDIDDSVQPYALVVPSGLFAGDARPRRLDIWFHGRGERESEMHFLAKHAVDDGIYTPADGIVLHPYGRYSNAFRFAGEQDVFEALRYVKSRMPIDSSRISVRGFSMGGAACWQFATRYPGRWFAANPGAGFSETVQFLDFFQGEKVLESAPDYQQAMWNLYDSPPVAVNLTNCPTIAYSGEVDRQKQAADVMVEACGEVGIELLHIIGPDTAHKIHPDSQIEIENRMSALAQRRRQTPRRIKFATYALQHNEMNWFTIEGLQQHWNKATVDAKLVTTDKRLAIDVSFQNVSAFSLNFAPGEWPFALDAEVALRVDAVGQPLVEAAQLRALSDGSLQADFYFDGQQWRRGKRPGLHKKPGLQGPIDDAFNSSFVFVLPSKKSSRAAFQAWAENEAEHAMQHWRQHFRGDVQAIKDVELDDAIIAKKNLVLFGDAESNSVIARVVEKLPLDHSRAAQRCGLSKDDVALAMIYPNPLNPERYVVLNSGFTYREYDYLNNARQTPKLPDWAAIDIRVKPTPRGPGKVHAAGFFDELWQLP